MSTLRWISFLLLGLAAVPLQAQGGLSAAPVDEANPGIELDFLNTVYQDLDSGLEPVTQGPLTIRFSSPTHRLEVFANRLWLTPLDGERFRVDAEVDFGGGGRLIADIEGAGLQQRFEDVVVAPRQTVQAQGEVTVRRLPDGYLFTMASADAKTTVRMESGFAQQIGSLCGVMALMPMMSLDCGPLKHALTHLGIPLVPQGTEMFLPAAWLDDDARQYLDKMISTPLSSAE